MDPRLPAPVQPVIADYISLINKQLPNRVCGVYLVGSLALGEFNERFSDIDFVVLLNQKAAPKEIETLGNIHRVIAKAHPRWEMSGSYILPQDLGKLDDEIGLHPHYHDGLLHPNSRSELNSVTWWELKNYGIAILGEAPDNLPFTVDWNVLLTKMRENLNSYWLNWTKQPGRVLRLYSDWGIQWAVLGVLRQFYTFREHSITTKVKAGQYALSRLPVRWHNLIQEAIDIRQGKKESRYRLRLLRTVEAIHFLKYVILCCNTSRGLT